MEGRQIPNLDVPAELGGQEEGRHFRCVQIIGYWRRCGRMEPNWSMQGVRHPSAPGRPAEVI